MADSVCEAEYIMASDTAKKAVWLQKFIDELKVAPFVDGSILLYCDSTRAIAQAKESKSHQYTKHILATTTLSERSWIEVMSTFKRSMERRT